MIKDSLQDAWPALDQTRGGSGDYLGADAEELLWWCATAPDSGDIEVAGFATDDGAIILIRAMSMKWRKR